jgi:glycine/D-amino acid oxidase-like deaminating enzyme
VELPRSHGHLTMDTTRPRKVTNGWQPASRRYDEISFWSKARMQSAKPEPLAIVVVGAGIVGAAIAYNLAMSGAPVTVVERSTPASGATAVSFARLGRLAGLTGSMKTSPFKFPNRGTSPVADCRKNRATLAARHLLQRNARQFCVRRRRTTIRILPQIERAPNGSRW